MSEISSGTVLITGPAEAPDARLQASPGHLRGPQIAAVTVIWRCSRGTGPRSNAPCAAGVM
jgi:hypothetical protein